MGVLRGVIGGLTLALTGAFWADGAQAEIVNHRNSCERWEHVPASEALGSPAAALLFCSAEDKLWLALRVECHVNPAEMVLHYAPGYFYDRPEAEEEDVLAGSGDTSLDGEWAAAVALVDAIPYEDSGIRTQNLDFGGTTEMVFMDFRSFGYTAVSDYDEALDAWRFVEKEPLAPMFSRLISGNYADIKIMAYDKTDRFPLRGSSKALRPVVETCRLAKRAEQRAKK